MPEGAPSGAARVLFLDPFHGGSHRAFAEGWAKHSRHEFTLQTLPARFWKWRMRGAALHFARKVTDPAAYDALVVTDLMSLSDLRALWGQACPPALAYFHENQLSYPLPPGEAMDYQFGFTDITTCLAARRVLFNSRFQHEAFFDRLPGFLGMMPEFQPRRRPAPRRRFRRRNRCPSAAGLHRSTSGDMEPSLGVRQGPGRLLRRSRCGAGPGR